MGFAMPRTTVLTQVLAIMTMLGTGCVCRLMLVVFAGVAASQRAIAIVMATSWMRWAFVVEAARQMRTTMAFVMTWILALVRWTLAEFATARARFTLVVVATFLRAIAIATVTSWTRWAIVVEAAQRMWTMTAFAMTWILALVRWTLAEFATAQARFTLAVAATFLRAIAIVMARNQCSTMIVPVRA